MGGRSKIEWTDHTFNPWWGCVRVSPGCEHCYAETFSKRVGEKVWGVDAPRRFFGEKHWREPLKWDEQAAIERQRRRVFCASMADVFEDRRDLDEWRAKLWALIEITPWLDWQLLTKRPENFDKLAPGAWVTRECPANVWIGTTAEDQRRADERISRLLRIPAAVRFISAEPLLGPLELESYLDRGSVFMSIGGEAKWRPNPAVNWVIVGGESGPGARPFDLAWPRSIIAQCKAAVVPVFVKQLGARPFESAGDPDGGPLYGVRDRKGGDPDEWPYDVRVREFPDHAPALR